MKNIIRIAYFDGDNSALIKGPVKKVVERLANMEEVNGVAIAPHWKFGPHLDIIVECNNDFFNEHVYESCRSEILEWLAISPSITEIDEKDYVKRSQQLALVEIESPPFLPLLKNNEVTRAKYEPNETLKLDVFKELKFDFLCDSLPFVYQLIDLKENNKRDYFVTLSFMLAICGTKYHKVGLARGFNSFRSHAEFFYVQYDKTGRVRAQFDAVASKYKESLDPGIRALLDRDVDKVSENLQLQNIITRWSSVVDRYFDSISDTVKSNHDFLKSENIFVEKLTNVAKDIPVELHQDEKKGPMAIAIEQDQGQKMLQSKEFMAYRTLVNFFYFILPIVGVSPAEKYCICNMTAGSVERILDISWRDLMIPGHFESRKRASA